jgi:hypothetical protein
MTETYSKSRQQAEIAFGNKREAKTLRLRAARLSKELADSTAATGALLAKRTRTK